MAGTIEGLMSNLNTSEIVEAIMQYERRNVDLLEYRKAEKTNELTQLPRQSRVGLIFFLWMP